MTRPNQFLPFVIVTLERGGGHLTRLSDRLQLGNHWRTLGNHATTLVMVVRTKLGVTSSTLAFVVAAAQAVALPPESSPPAPPPQPAQGASDEVVVVGRPPHCRPRADDPQDAVDLSVAASGVPQVIQRNAARGSFELVKDTYPETGPEVWQRAAQHMNNFIYRTPDHGGAICIGQKSRFSQGEAQLRRAFAARPYWGKYMLLTAFVATRDAGRVDMWIAGGASDPRPVSVANLGRDIVAGGFKRVPLVGNYEWQQVNFLIGPIPCMASQISYGVQLQGGGDVWLARPSFVEVPEDKLSPSMKKLPHGAAMLSSDPICRHNVKGDPLFVRRGQTVVPLAANADLYPGLVLYSKPDGAPIPYSESFAPGIIEF